MVSVEPFMSIPPFPIFMIGVLAQSSFAVSLLPSSQLLQLAVGTAY